MPKYIHPVQRISVSDTTFSGTVRITGAGNITVGSDASGGVVSGSQSAQTQSLIQAISNSETAYNTGTVILSEQANITINSSVNGASQYFRFSAPAGATPVISHWKLVPGGVGGQQTLSVPNAQQYLIPIHIPANLTAHIARIYISGSGASGSSAQVSWSVNVYTKTGTRISTISNASSTYSWTSNTNASDNWGGVFGQRRWDITNANFSFTPGDYVIGIWQRSTNAGSYSYLAQTGLGNAFSGKLGAVNNTTIAAVPGAGAQSVSTAALPNTIAYSDIQHWPGSNQKPPDFALLHSSYSDV